MKLPMGEIAAVDGVSVFLLPAVEPVAKEAS